MSLFSPKPTGRPQTSCPKDRLHTKSLLKWGPSGGGHCPLSLGMYPCSEDLAMECFYSFLDKSKIVFLTIEQALLSEKLIYHDLVPHKWWSVLRAVTTWFIWKARNSLALDDVALPSQVTCSQIWQRMHLQIKNQWEKQNAKVKVGQLTEDKAKALFRKDNGTNETLFKFVGLRVEVSRTPPPPLVFTVLEKIK